MEQRQNRQINVVISVQLEYPCYSKLPVNTQLTRRRDPNLDVAAYSRSVTPGQPGSPALFKSPSVGGRSDDVRLDSDQKRSRKED